MNIRPFTDALRKHGGAWGHRWDTRMGGARMVQVERLYRGQEPVTGNQAKAGDRFIRLQWNEGGNHSADHMLVTRDGVIYEKGPGYMRGTTSPTPFRTPAEMLDAIRREQTRQDHKS